MNAYQRRSRVDIAHHQRDSFFFTPVARCTRPELAFKAHNAEVSPARGKVGLSHFADCEFGAHIAIIDGTAYPIPACYHLCMPPPLDTTPEIEAMQIRILRSMSIEQRLEIALEISLLSRALMKAGVRDQHPD